MTTRLLPANEWAKLRGTELDAVWPRLPETAQIVVVEDGDQIVGCWALLPVWHLEGVYIAPEHRKRGAVARRLWTGMQRLLRASGVSSVATAACSDEVRALLAHLGATQLPGDHYVLPIGGR